ncbi:predicted protein [Phaeodactylum tricornutum CCAP 1055/1]|uniref:Prolyl 4-hydroxylase alpha subunit domain-containing protein n=2 Tax=Phaeodactylum tricornutum TaxID=2850 RepID=B7FW42_PHATC|nr:predicted protein [Phaeodactylum tricornutum CCAP 1055/1]EEC49517.1 predicted protein [Phaeodactylum tricornutum CCAP 1055/1]|eukprot:XP_002178819.1 predicted protein [Phaeodactylum tricornutum CCAP 1055/1]
MLVRMRLRPHFCVVFLSLLCCGVDATSSAALRRHLEFVNRSGERISVDWLNPLTGQPVLLGAPVNGETIPLDSFVNHTFAIRQHQDGQKVKRFETPSLSTTHTRTLEAPTTKSSLRAIESLQTCLEYYTALILEDKNEELAFQAQVREQISALAENHTCADPMRTTTEPIEMRSWRYLDEDPRTVQVLHNRPSSQIHVLEGFISPEECQAIKDAAAPKLHRGTVADGKGGSKLSESRKAWQAGVGVDYSHKNAISDLKKRLFAYTNEVTGFNMNLDGQEDIMSIQYFGDGVGNPTPDRYTPHCDGECNGMPHKRGGRVATMVMYCDIPEIGGGTNFQHSNVFVAPTIGAAAFFSYMNNDTGLHETGFTTHSGCPVLEGTKRIAVQWMRVGVDEDSPWDSFDTNTVQKGSFIEDSRVE